VFADDELISVVDGCHTCCIEDLNTSDHVPIVARICLSQLTTNPVTNKTPLQIDWTQAVRDGTIANYAQAVSNGFANLTQDSSNTRTVDINHDFNTVTSLLLDAAEKTLPVIRTKSRHKHKDKTLSALCAQSSQARRKWIEEGRPMEGPLYEEKFVLYRAVRKRVRYCVAQEKNRRNQRRETSSLPTITKDFVNQRRAGTCHINCV